MISEGLAAINMLTPADKAALAMIFITSLCGAFIGATLAVVAMHQGPKT